MTDVNTGNAPASGVVEGGVTGSTGGSDWRSAIPEEIRNEKSIEHFKGVDDLARSYINAQKMIGGRIPIPKEGDNDSWNEVWNKLGRPETPDKYNVKLPEVAGAALAPELQQEFMKLAHSLGLNNKQVQEVLNFEAQRIEKQSEVFGQAMQEAEMELKKEYGKAYDQKIASAQRAVKSLGDENFAKLMDETGLGNHPAMIKFAAKIGDMLTEDQAVATGSTFGAMTPGEANQRISDLRNDMSFVTRYTAGDAAAKAEMERLHKFAYPE